MAARHRLRHGRLLHLSWLGGDASRWRRVDGFERWIAVAADEARWDFGPYDAGWDHEMGDGDHEMDHEMDFRDEAQHAGAVTGGGI